MRQLLGTAAKIPHSSMLPGQPFHNPLKGIQTEISHLISCHGYELECYLLKSLFSYSLEMCRDEKNVQKLANEDPQVRILVVVVVVVYVCLLGILTEDTITLRV